jgi:hypothetical protein
MCSVLFSGACVASRTQVVPLPSFSDPEIGQAISIISEEQISGIACKMCGLLSERLRVANTVFIKCEEVDTTAPRREIRLESLKVFFERRAVTSFTEALQADLPLGLNSTFYHQGYQVQVMTIMGPPSEPIEGVAFVIDQTLKKDFPPSYALSLTLDLEKTKANLDLVFVLKETAETGVLT